MPHFNNGIYYSANEFFKSKFGCKIIKIPVNGGFTCPNRDGTLSRKGCIFCSGSGSGEFAGSSSKSITEQFFDIKNKLSKKWPNGKYIVYFQAFTNTYAPAEILSSLYNEAALLPDVVGISIATRPDCIDDKVMNVIQELSKKLYVCVELGLQTSKPESINLINRCYSNDVYLNAIKMLNSKNIDTISHIILGLPYETKQDMINTVKFAVLAGTKGIKLQLLHVLKGTELEKMYNENKFSTLTLEEYCDILISCIEILPPEIVIHRITGDGDKKILTAPLWSANKKYVLNKINIEFTKRTTFQSKNCFLNYI